MDYGAFSPLYVFSVGFGLGLQYKRKVMQPKGALHVTASAKKNILIMGGTRFIGIFLSRLLVKEGHQVLPFSFFFLCLLRIPH